MATLSPRRLWVIYKRTAIKEGLSPRERINTQLAFYSGARGVLKVLAHLIEQGEYEELHETIRRHGRLIERIQGSAGCAHDATGKPTTEDPGFLGLSFDLKAVCVPVGRGRLPAPPHPRNE
jgi:hypothetical protein